MNPLKWPILCIAGIAAVSLYCSFTFISLALFPTPYSPVENWLSDLGNSNFNPSGAVFFNVGCVLTGLTLFPFFAGLYKWYTSERWRKILLVATQAVGFISAFALIMIGVFSEDYLTEHVFWTGIFFTLNIVVLILASTSLLTHPKFIRPIGHYGYAVAAINLILMTVGIHPLIEWITVFTALGYVGLIAYNTFKLAYTKM